jgi:hypothetical protein
MKLIWSFVLLMKISYATSQTVGRKVLDKQTNFPVSYATIKLLHIPGGAVSSEKGEFYLTIAHTDSVVISSAGYHSKFLIGREIGQEIFLEPQIRILEQVTVKGKTFLRVVHLGNSEKKIKGNQKWALTKEGKDEFAQKIELPDSLLTYKIKKIFIPVRKTVCWEPLLVHIYAEDSTSQFPGEELLVKPVHVTPQNVSDNKIVLDLNSENLYLKNSKYFFVSISRLPDTGATKCLTTLLVSRSSTASTYSRTLYSSSYEWFVFGQMKDKNGAAFEVRTFYGVEADEMK